MIKGTKNFWDLLGEILAVALIVVYAVLILNANLAFIPQGTFLGILELIRTYGSLVLIAVVGFEALADRNIVIKIIFILLIALIVVFMFFPGTYTNLIGLVQK
jgi:hypothetical protein